MTVSIGGSTTVSIGGSTTVSIGGSMTVSVSMFDILPVIGTKSTFGSELVKSVSFMSGVISLDISLGISLDISGVSVS